MNITEQIISLRDSLPTEVTLVAVSKTHAPETVMEAYEAGQRIFGENRVQELTAKYEAMPKDIEWHLIGHLQTNKVKYIAPFVAMIQSVDSDRLLEVIDKEAAKNNRIIDILFEVHVADEESKSGWDIDELRAYIADGRIEQYKNIRVRGLMTIATLTDSKNKIRAEFTALKNLFDELQKTKFGSQFDTLSMGMTSDYDLAIECGSNMVRVGSLIFGRR